MKKISNLYLFMLISALYYNAFAQDLSEQNIFKSERKSSGPIFTFGYSKLAFTNSKNFLGDLDIHNFPDYDYENPKTFKNPYSLSSVNLYNFGFGRYWKGGNFQFLMDFYFSDKQRISTTSSGWHSYEYAYEGYYMGIIPRFRFGVSRNFYCNLGLGYFAYNRIELKGKTSNNNDEYPQLSIGFDVKLPIHYKNGLLLGLQYDKSFMSGEGPKPEWNIFKLQATVLRDFYPETLSSDEEQSLAEVSQGEKSFKLGEEMLFTSYQQKAHIKLDYSFMLSQTKQYYSPKFFTQLWGELYSSIFDLHQVMPLKPYLSLDFHIPYFWKIGQFEDNSMSQLPGVDFFFHSANGLGDVSTNLKYDIYKSQVKNFTASARIGLILPTGRSEYSQDYDGYFIFGNGFRCLDTQLNISKEFDNNTMLFGAIGYTFRSNRTFKYDEMGAPAKYMPEGIFNLTVGAGCLVHLFNDYKIINIEAAYYSLGEINTEYFSKSYDYYTGDSYKYYKGPAKGAYSIVRYGFRIVENIGKGDPSESFIGFQTKSTEYDSETIFIVNFALPLHLRLFKFYL